MILIGSLGTILLVLSGLPQLVKLIVSKKVDGISPISMFSVFLGCLLLFIYVLLTHGLSIILINYFANTLISLANFALYVKYKK
jgi:uncharacterized protein with PQ loop repeat